MSYKENLERFKNPTVIITNSGKYFDISYPDKSDIDIKDITKHLSNLCRWNGAVTRFYSVAEHSVLVHMVLVKLTHNDLRLCLTGLLHDAHEAYIGDIVSPAAIAIQNEAQTDAISIIKREIDGAINLHFKNEYKIELDFENPVIKEADNIVRTWEALNVVEYYPIETLKSSLVYIVEQIFSGGIEGISEKPSYAEEIFHGMIMDIVNSNKLKNEGL